jgi:hypothetical protein
MSTGGTKQRSLKKNRTELFVIGTRIFGRILEDVGRAGGETTVREDAHLDVLRVDLWEEREAIGPKFRPGLGGTGTGGSGGGGNGRRRSARHQGTSEFSLGRWGGGLQG